MGKSSVGAMSGVRRRVTLEAAEAVLDLQLVAGIRALDRGHDTVAGRYESLADVGA